MKLSEDVRTVSDLKTHAARLLDQARRSHRPVLLTRRGRGVAVLLDLAERSSTRARRASGVAAGAAL